MKGKTGSPSQELEQSIRFRRILDRPHVEASLFHCAVASTAAHVKMLGSTGIIPADQAQLLQDALVKVHENPDSVLHSDDLDVYSALERHLAESLGSDTAALIRTAKSTNDQMATDMRIWLRCESMDIAELLLSLRRAFITLAERDLEVIMPGYTHMQPAEVILLSHWWLANEARFERDFSRLSDLFRRLNRLPLGAGVLSGATEPIDRSMVAQLLGFDDVIENSVDAISDRDFLVEFASFASLVGLHLSQLGSELLLWATQEFAFIWLPPNFTIESLRLPLKRNPELLEVLRSRPSKIHGHLIEFLFQLKGITSGFAQDLQESIPGLAEVVENLCVLLELTSAVVPGIEIDSIRMKEVACADLVNVSAAMEYLIMKGVERKVASKVVTQLGTYCRARNKFLSDLALSEWQQFSPAFERDIYDLVSMEQSVGAYCSFGGSSQDQVEQALSRAHEGLASDEKEIVALRERCSFEHLWG